MNNYKLGRVGVIFLVENGWERWVKYITFAKGNVRGWGCFCFNIIYFVCVAFSPGCVWLKAINKNDKHNNMLSKVN